MKVSDVMTTGVETVSPDATLVDAAKRMDDLNVGAIPVCDEDERLLGLLTDRDIVVRGIAAGFDPNSRTVGEIMTEPVITCHEEDDVHEVIRLMEENQIRRVVVLDEDDKLCGIVSLGDIAVELHDEHLSSEALEKISEPSEPAA